MGSAVDSMDAEIRRRKRRSERRANLAILGSALALVGYFLDTTYSVTFSPPPSSALSRIVLTHLSGFTHGHLDTGSPPGTQLVWFNGHSGPINLKASLIAIIVCAVVGVIASFIDIDRAHNVITRLLQYTGHTVSIVGSIFGVGGVIWQFRNNHTPSAITNRFIASLGGGTAAHQAVHYLSADIELGAILIIAGLLIAGAAINLRQRGVAIAYLTLAALLGLIYAL